MFLRETKTSSQVRGLGSTFAYVVCFNFVMIIGKPPVLLYLQDKQTYCKLELRYPLKLGSCPFTGTGRHECYLS